MRIRVDQDRFFIRPYVVVVVLRTNKDRIAYNSGLTYFYHKEALEVFVKEIKKGNPNLEIHHVDTLDAHEPPEDRGRGYWCPFCKSWEYWMADSGGYKRCPICGISDNEYYVKRFNRLWTEDMKSKKQKKQQEKGRKKK